MREAEEARTDGVVWRLINRERKYKKEINEDIGMKEWKEHFMVILGDVEKGKGEG